MKLLFLFIFVNSLCAVDNPCEVHEQIFFGSKRKDFFKNHSRIIKMEDIQSEEKVFNVIDSIQSYSFPAFPLALEHNEPVVYGRFPSTYVLTLRNAKVFSNIGYILVGNDNKILFNTIWDWEEEGNAVWSDQFEFHKEIQEVNGTVAVIAQRGANNYYHWMTEILPRIHLLQRAGIHYDYLYVPELVCAFQRDSLASLGIDSSKIIQGNAQALVQPTQLIVPSMPSVSTITPLWVIEFLRNSFIDNNFSKTNKKNKGIYISRKNADLRRVSNEQALIDLLKDFFAIETIVLEGLTIKEQAKLFHEASIIIAPHGAGLTNLVFAKKNTPVIEIFQYHLDETFWLLSQQLMLRHHCISGISQQEIEKLKDPIFANNEARYMTTDLDLEAIKASLDAIRESLIF